MSDELQKSEDAKRRREYAPDLDEQRSPDFEETSTFEHLAQSAKEQASDAAEALRQGGLMEDAQADLTATSEDRLIALLCYWSQILLPAVLPVIVLLSESGKRRPFQRHHAAQSLALTAACMGLIVAVFFVTAMVGAILPPVGFLLGLAAFCLSPIAYFMAITAYVFYGWQSNKGKRFSIPILSNFLRQKGWMD